MFTKVVTITVFCLGAALATPFGAPAQACADMKPMHPNTTVSPNPSPYTFVLTPTSTGATLTISANSGDWFRGFFVQARNSAGDAVGTYIIDPDIGHLVDCVPNIDNAASHHDATDKTSVTMEWVAPSPPVPVTVLK